MNIKTVSKIVQWLQEGFRLSAVLSCVPRVKQLFLLSEAWFGSKLVPGMSVLVNWMGNPLFVCCTVFVGFQLKKGRRAAMFRARPDSLGHSNK